MLKAQPRGAGPVWPSTNSGLSDGGELRPVLCAWGRWGLLLVSVDCGSKCCQNACGGTLGGCPVRVAEPESCVSSTPKATGSDDCQRRVVLEQSVRVAQPEKDAPVGKPFRLA